MMNKVDLFTDTDIKLAEHAEVIRALGKRVVGDIIEIGRRLIDAKERCGHGNWLPWLEREFGWTDQTARRFMQVAEASKSNNLLNLSVDVSGLYLLAAPSTPVEVVDAAVERSEGGQKLSVKEVKRMIAEAEAKGRAEVEAEIETLEAGRVGLEAEITKLETKYAKREQEIRAEFESAKLSERDIKALIKQVTEPLKKKIKAYKEQLDNKTPKIALPSLSYENVSVSHDLGRLAESISKITPERMIEVYRERVAMTNELALKPLEDDEKNCAIVLTWLARFQTLAEENGK